jgi:hypothetical protein
MKLKYNIAAFAALTLLLGCAQENPMEGEKTSSTPALTNQTQTTANKFDSPGAPVTPPDARSTNGVIAPPADALAVHPPANTNNDEKK